MLEVTGQVSWPRSMNSDILTLLISLASAQSNFKNIAGRLSSLGRLSFIHLPSKLTTTAHMLLGFCPPRYELIIVLSISQYPRSNIQGPKSIWHLNLTWLVVIPCNNSKILRATPVIYSCHFPGEVRLQITWRNCACFPIWKVICPEWANYDFQGNVFYFRWKTLSQI